MGFPMFPMTQLFWLTRGLLLFPYDITCQAIDAWKPGAHQLNLVAEKKNNTPGSLASRLKIYHPKGKVIFQPSSFRGELLNFRGVTHELHPSRLTWNLQITHLERKMIMVHVNLPECTWALFISLGVFFHNARRKISLKLSTPSHGNLREPPQCHPSQETRPGGVDLRGVPLNSHDLRHHPRQLILMNKSYTLFYKWMP